MEREDETLSMTWLDEDEVATLLGAAGYAGIAILPSPWPRGARSFGVSARAEAAGEESPVFSQICAFERCIVIPFARPSRRPR